MLTGLHHENLSPMGFQDRFEVVKAEECLDTIREAWPERSESPAPLKEVKTVSTDGKRPRLIIDNIEDLLDEDYRTRKVLECVGVDPEVVCLSRRLARAGLSQIISAPTYEEMTLERMFEIAETFGFEVEISIKSTPGEGPKLKMVGS